MSATERIEEIMTKQVECVTKDTKIREVARMMRERDIGDVLVVTADRKLSGIVTDRDLVVRAIAEGKNPDTSPISDVCTGDPVSLTPDASVDQAIQMMREQAVRRIPVVRDGVPVGIVSIGDLAKRHDPRSALAQISAAAPNN